MSPVIIFGGQQPPDLHDSDLQKLETALSKDPVINDLMQAGKVVVKIDPPSKRCFTLVKRHKINSIATVHAQDEVVAQTIRAILLRLGLCTKVLINRVPHVAHLPQDN